MHPESPVSPRNPARQQIVSAKKGVCFKHLATQERSTRNLRLTKSRNISPDIEPGPALDFRPEIVREFRDRARYSLSRPSLNGALINQSRPESLPDRKSSSQKGGCVSAVSRRKSGSRGEKGCETIHTCWFFWSLGRDLNQRPNPKDDLLFHRHNTCAERSTRTLAKEAQCDDFDYSQILEMRMRLGPVSPRAVTLK